MSDAGLVTPRVSVAGRVGGSNVCLGICVPFRDNWYCLAAEEECDTLSISGDVCCSDDYGGGNERAVAIVMRMVLQMAMLTSMVLLFAVLINGEDRDNTTALPNDRRVNE